MSDLERPARLHHIGKLLFAEGRRRRLRKGELVYGSGDEADTVCGLVRGVIKLYALTPGGRQVVFSFATPGSIFGELALVDPSKRDHFAEAREPVELRTLPVTAFRDLLNHRPEVGLELARHYGARLKRVSRALAGSFFRSTSLRVASALVDLANEHGVADGSAILVDLRLSQEELGGLAGVSRERVNGCLSFLRELGLVEMKARKLRLADVDEVARLSRPQRPGFAEGRGKAVDEESGIPRSPV